MPAPAQLPEWASDPGAVITEPSAGKKAQGWLSPEKPPDGQFNWWMNLVYLWIDYFAGVVGAAAEALGTAGADVNVGASPAPGGADWFLTTDSATAATWKPLTAANLGLQTAWLGHQVALGNHGGGLSTAGWNTRTLNVEDDADGIVTLTGNQFTLGPGRYLIQWSVPGYQLNGHMSRLFNISDAVAVKPGSTAFGGQTLDVNTVSSGFADVTIAAAKTFEIQHKPFTSALNVIDGGRASNIDVETYTQVWIYKIG